MTHDPTPTVIETPFGWQIVRGGDVLTMPNRVAVSLPTRALAMAMAEALQEKTHQHRYASIPSYVNMVLEVKDNPRAQKTVIDMLVSFARHDLLCIRAAAPDALVARQRAMWDPWVQWAEKRFGCAIQTSNNIAVHPLSPAFFAAVGHMAQSMDSWRRVLWAAGAQRTSSAVLSLALLEDAMDVETAWQCSTLDAQWQNEQWGKDSMKRRSLQEERSAIESVVTIARLLCAAA